MSNSLFGYRRIAALCVLCLVTCGCITISRPEPGEPLYADSGNGIVFGRIRLLDRDAEQFPWDTEWQLDHTATFVRTRPPPLQRPVLGLYSVDGDRRSLAPTPDHKGWFVWELPKGRYLLFLADSLHGGPATAPATGGQNPLYVLAALQVKGDTASDYVGDLVIEVEADWVLGNSSASYSIKRLSVQSAEVDARRWIEGSFPGSNIRLSAPRIAVDAALADLLIDYSKSRTEAVLRGVLPEAPSSEER